MVVLQLACYDKRILFCRSLLNGETVLTLIRQRNLWVTDVHRPLLLGGTHTRRPLLWLLSCTGHNPNPSVPHDGTAGSVGVLCTALPLQLSCFAAYFLTPTMHSTITLLLRIGCFSSSKVLSNRIFFSLDLTSALQRRWIFKRQNFGV